MYPLAGKEHLQLRKEQGDNGRGIRDGGRMAGKLRGEHERRHRKDSATETQNRLTGGSIYVYRTADSIACLP